MTRCCPLHINFSLKTGAFYFKTLLYNKNSTPVKLSFYLKLPICSDKHNQCLATKKNVTIICPIHLQTFSYKTNNSNPCVLMVLLLHNFI
jgi:hypothetical protein